MKALSWIGWVAATLFCIEVGLNALRYLLPGFAGPEFIMANPMARPWLYVHAPLGALALMIGPLQFVQGVRRRAPRLHRWMGRVYIVCALMGGFAGLLLATGSAAGPIARVGFGGAAVISIVCAWQAWRLALARRFDAHRNWVIRSYAVIFAAVTLRIWLPLSGMAHLDFMESYRAISFLAWVPNLIVAELYLRARPKLSLTASSLDRSPGRAEKLRAGQAF